MPNSNKPNDGTEGNGKVTTSASPSNNAEASDVERLQEQVRKEHEMYLRALADFDNFRRRVERERASAAQSGKREMILSMIEALDGFDRALDQMGDANSSVIEGLQAIRRRLLAVLEAQGVAPFSSVGQVFNPELHEAIASVNTDAHEPGIIVDEVQRGYRWGDAVLRPARVRVAQ
jgi:molecular chaperone GrpE